MEPCFQQKLGEQIYPRLVAVGRFDGTRPCLACATTTGKILIHDPHGDHSGNNVRFLSIQKKVTALATGRFEGSDKDYLFIGSPTDLLVYDVDENKDLYHKDVPDGVSALTIGRIGNKDHTSVFTGGNCSITGFDRSGKVDFFTVFSSTVCSMCLCDVAGDGTNLLLVGADDYGLRLYTENAQMMHEFRQVEAAMALGDLGDKRFAYALKSGAVGAFDGVNRSWRVKMSAKPSCLAVYDMTMDGNADVVVGWTDGSLEVREDREGGAGAIVVRDKFSSAVAGVLACDYRMNGTSMLLAVSVDGDVRGYMPLGVKEPASSSKQDLLGGKKKPKHRMKETSPSPPPGPSKAVIDALERQIKELEQQKREVLVQLQRGTVVLAQKDPEHHDTGDAVGGSVTASLGVDVGEVDGSAHPVNTMTTDPTGRRDSVVLTVTADNDHAVIDMVVINTDMYVASIVEQPAPHAFSNTLSVRLPPTKNQRCALTARIVYGGRGSSNLRHMHEIALDLPRFASLVPCCSADRCQSQCTLPLRGFVYEVQIAQWLEREFLSPVPRLDAQHMVRMRDIRDDTPVVICLLANTIVIETPSMELAGDLVQSMLQSLGVTDLGCVANFPTVVAAAQDAMSAISDYSDVGQRLSGAMGGHTALAKGLLYQAEDARVLRVLGPMKDAYRNLFTLNQTILAQYKIRSNNQRDMVDALKALRQYMHNGTVESFVERGWIRLGVEPAAVARVNFHVGSLRGGIST